MTMSYKNSTGTVEEDDLLKKKPGEWQDPYEDKWSGYMKQYTSRKPFSYDINADALYDQYKDQYIQQGRMAMMDTMGQAAALTGGYGNSYAQSVGQQAYNQQLNQLNNVIPDLYGMALDRYNQQGDDLLAKYNLYKGLSEESYYNHQTDLENWYKEFGIANDAGGTGNGTNGGTGDSGIDLNHVASMSSYELVGYLENYQKKENNAGLEAFLDDCVLTGRLTKDQADEYYAKYRTGKDDDAVDTTIPSIGGGGVSKPGVRSGGGGGSKYMLEQW